MNPIDGSTLMVGVCEPYPSTEKGSLRALSCKIKYLWNLNRGVFLLCVRLIRSDCSSDPSCNAGSHPLPSDCAKDHCGRSSRLGFPISTGSIDSGMKFQPVGAEGMLLR